MPDENIGPDGHFLDDFDDDDEDDKEEEHEQEVEEAYEKGKSEGGREGFGCGCLVGFGLALLAVAMGFCHPHL